MTTALIVILAAAVVAAVVGLVVRWSRHPAERGAGWRLAVLVVAQPLCAGLLYLTLTAVAEQAGGTLVVATRGAGAAAGLGGDRIVALPEAPAIAGADRVPDLGTALRRFRPDRLRVVGAGLRARDRDAVGRIPLDFAPGAPPHGLVRLDPPPPVAAGAAFAVGGRIAGIDRPSADLVDPAGRLVDSAVPDAAGDFVLTGTARAAGPTAFTVRVRSGARIVDAAAVPLWVDAAAARRVLILAGAPGPEVKYLRRWANDAGMAVHAEVATGGGLALGDAPLPLTVATLARFDVAVIDTRRWLALTPGERGAFGAAVRNGLGVIVRIDAPLTDATRTALRPLGFAVAGGDDLVAMTLAGTTDEAMRRARAGPGTADAPAAVNRDSAAPALSRWAVRVTAPAMTPLLRDGRGGVVAVWRAAGQGRVALWPLADAYRLVLAGRGDSYAELWSAAVATVGRSGGQTGPSLTGPARVDERATTCGVAEGTRVVAPDGHATLLRRDIGAGSCAAFWPAVAGWHQLVSPDREARTAVNVAAAGDLPNAAATADREATLRLAGSPAAGSHDAPAPRSRSPWPWFAAWLLASGALWWFERSRLGRTAA